MSADSPVTAVRDQAEQRQARSRPARSSTRRPTAGRSKKGSPLAQSLQKALEHLIETGDYKTIATNWGVEAGMIDKPVINGATS